MYDLNFWIELILLEMIAICSYLILLYLVRFTLKRHYYKKEFNNITKRIECKNISDDDVWNNIVFSFKNLPFNMGDIDVFLKNYIEFLTNKNKIKLVKKITKWVLVCDDYIKYKMKNIPSIIFLHIVKTNEAINQNNTKSSIENLTISIAEELSKKQQVFSWHSILKIVGMLIGNAIAIIKILQH